MKLQNSWCDPALLALRNWALTVAILGAMLFSVAARAQQSAADSAAAALSSALTAACKQDSATFADTLTAENATAYRALPGPQRTAMMKRFVLLDVPGRPLLSSSGAGRGVVRCETPGYTVEMRFGEARSHENLAFVPIDIPLPGETTRSITFGLVREGGNWKLLSVGLILLDIPSMARQWEQADMDEREDNAIANLRAVAAALETYRRAYGDWPESLALLGPAPPGGVSPQAAGLVDADLAAGTKDGYAIRYSIVPAGGNAAAGESSKPETFVLAASPGEYGKSGRRSFFLDSVGVLHGADKQGGVANSADPRITPSGQ